VKQETNSVFVTKVNMVTRCNGGAKIILQNSAIQWWYAYHRWYAEDRLVVRDFVWELQCFVIKF